MLYSVRSSAVLLALVAMLAIAPIAPEEGNIIFLTVSALSLALLARHGVVQFRRPLVWMPLLGVALVAIAYVIGAGSADGLLGIAYFSPVFAILPLLAAADELQDEDGSALIGVLALGGVAATAAVAVSEVMRIGAVRAGGAVANPIHFADIALLAGFLSTAGLVLHRQVWRIMFLAGPLLAGIAVVLSGTRGAVVAEVAMVVVAVLLVICLRLISPRMLLVGLAVTLAGGIAAALLGAGHLLGIERVLGDVAEVFRSGVPSDASTQIRLEMVIGGWRAFLDAPIFGQGPLAFADRANELSGLPPGNWPHLHNDIADFAASGGLVGLLAYLLFMLAPIAEVARMPVSAAKPRIMVFAVILMTGYFVMGLTNAMFGILTVTTYYAVICVVVGILVRQASVDPQSLTPPASPAISRA